MTRFPFAAAHVSSITQPLLLFAMPAFVTLLLFGPAQAANIQFNTDTGAVLVNGLPATSVNGTHILQPAPVVGGVTQFKFLGDLNFNGSDAVTAFGSRPLSLIAGNDVNIAAGAVLNFDATGKFGKLGGGNAGNGGAPSSFIGIGGPGTAGGTGGAGGGGGFGGLVAGTNGGPGSPGTAGTGGGQGGSGQSGNGGQQGSGGFSNPSGGAASPGGGGTAGTGSGGGPAGLHGVGGPGGAGYMFIVSPEPGDPGFTGLPGMNGSGGGDGGDGTPGSGGQHSVSGNLLSAGGGGAGGGSGGNGGGGGGGGGGAGGGGGGGGGGGNVGFAGAGGMGGGGNTGGGGGNGGKGSTGGSGGSGGGAVEIIAWGRFNLQGSASVRGAAGGFASVGDPGSGGGSPLNNGSAPFGGEQRASTSLGGSGGDGGDGGVGGSGGNGGTGGRGGQGGGGAGGTLRFQGSLFDGTGGTINTSGGTSAMPGGNGRYLVANNSLAAPVTGTRIGAQFQEFFQDNAGGGDINPFLDGGTTQTSYIPDLVGGADVYGVVDGSGAFNLDAEIAALRAAAPAGAIAAVARTQSPFYRQDAVMLINLTATPLENLRLGATIQGGASGFSIPLQTRGFAENASFGGDGPDALAQLPGGAMFATLAPVPPVNPPDYIVSGQANDAAILNVALSSGANAIDDFVYLTSTAPRLDVRPTGPLNSAAALGDAENSTFSATYNGPAALLSRFSMHGSLTEVQSTTWASEALINMAKGTAQLSVQHSSQHSFTGTIEVSNTQNMLIFANPGDTFEFETFESTDDGPGADAVYNDLIISFDKEASVTDLGVVTGAGVTLDTFGSDFDTELALYTLDGQLVAENDQSGGDQSQLIETLTAGDYLAVVGGNNSVFGNGLAMPGAAAGDYLLSLNGVEVALGSLAGSEFAVFSLTVEALAGDYNSDGVVDAVDYSVWRSNLGAPAGTLANDIDGGLIGPAQYATWRANYGATLPAPATGTAAPEPCSVAILCLVGGMLSLCSRTDRLKR